jgi:hypothetical protein
LKAFNPERIAYYEANGWRAYYDRKWLRLLRLIVALAQEEFRIPFPNSLLAAYYVTRADWRSSLLAGRRLLLRLDLQPKFQLPARLGGLSRA